MKRVLILMAAVGMLAACGEPAVDLSNKDFSDTFKQGFKENCLKQARGMSKADAKEYCNCSLRQIMLNWDSEDKASMDLNGMPGYEVHRLLVAPCMQ
jgi:hypothetical protein